MRYFWLILAAALTGCTVSLMMVHTQGTASDVVDEQQTPKTDVTASIPKL